MKKLACTVLILLGFLRGPDAYAQIIPTLPVTLQNGTLADANQVMSNFNTIVTGVNTNGAKNGVNSDITALNSLTTPLTPAQGGSPIYTAGTSTGSGNAQVVASPTPTGFSLVAGKTVMFTAGFTNSGPATLNVAGTGALNIFQRTAAGAVALTGGEIVAGAVAMAYYDGTRYQLIDSVPQNVTNPCTIVDYGGVDIPTGYLATDGSAQSRTTFATLFGCLNRTVSATTSTGSASVTVASSANIQIGWYVGGTNVTCNSKVISKADGTHFTMNNNAGGNGATTLTVGPNPQGDCSTTFNLPDLNGRATVMADAAGSTLTSTTCTNPATLGSPCGAQTYTIQTANLPPYTPAGTIAVTAVAQATRFFSTAGSNDINTLSQGNSGGTFVSPNGVPFVSATAAFTGTAAPGQVSTPHSIIQPIGLVYKAIKF